MSGKLSRDLAELFQDWRFVYANILLITAVVFGILGVVYIATTFLINIASDIFYFRYTTTVLEWKGAGTGFLPELREYCAYGMVEIGAEFIVMGLILAGFSISTNSAKELAQTWTWEPYVAAAISLFLQGHWIILAIGLSDLGFSLAYPLLYGLTALFILFGDIYKETTAEGRSVGLVGFFIGVLVCAVASVVTTIGIILFYNKANDVIPWTSWVILGLVLLEFLAFLVMDGVSIANVIAPSNGMRFFFFVKPYVIVAISLFVSLVLSLSFLIAGFLETKNSYGSSCN